MKPVTTTDNKKSELLKARRSHFTFTILYGLIAIVQLLIPVAFLYFTITFQSGLLYISLFSFGVIFASRPDKNGRVPRENRVAICTSLAISLICVVLCMINPASILITECPKYSPHSDHHSHHHHHHKKSPHYEMIAPFTENTLDILIRYQKIEDGVDQSEHVLMMKYNQSSKRIEHREWDRVRNSWRTTVSQLHTQSMDPVCTTDKYSRFLFLEDEIESEIRDRREHLESQSSIRYTSHDSNNGQTTTEEDQFDLNRWVKRICRNEVGFTIAYLVFMGLLIILQFFTILWYAFQVKS